MGSAYHMDPLLLAIQVSELVRADVDQGAQVTVISAEEEKGGVAQAQVSHIPWPGPNNSLPTSGASRQANVTQPPSPRAGNQHGPGSPGARPPARPLTTQVTVTDHLASVASVLFSVKLGVRGEFPPTEL